MKIRYLSIIALCATLFALSGCDVPTNQTADQKQNQQQAIMNVQAVNAVGMPAITNFQEKRILKNILELRDQQISTVTYITDLYGKLHKVCDSIGYGIPYSTQYTSPQRTMTFSEYEHSPTRNGDALMPQAEPNGLYSPAAADGTWVMCLDAGTKKLAPVYIEPHVVVSPFPLSIQ